MPSSWSALNDMLIAPVRGTRLGGGAAAQSVGPSARPGPRSRFGRSHDCSQTSHSREAVPRAAVSLLLRAVRRGRWTGRTRRSRARDWRGRGLLSRTAQGCAVARSASGRRRRRRRIGARPTVPRRFRVGRSDAERAASSAGSCRVLSGMRAHPEARRESVPDRACTRALSAVASSSRSITSRGTREARGACRSEAR